MDWVTYRRSKERADELYREAIGRKKFAPLASPGDSREILSLQVCRLGRIAWGAARAVLAPREGGQTEIPAVRQHSGEITFDSSTGCRIEKHHRPDHRLISFTWPSDIGSDEILDLLSISVFRANQGQEQPSLIIRAMTADSKMATHTWQAGSDPYKFLQQYGPNIQLALMEIDDCTIYWYKSFSGLNRSNPPAVGVMLSSSERISELEITMEQTMTAEVFEQAKPLIYQACEFFD